MDWTNERYVRVYTRDTVDYLVLSWQARGLWLELLRKADRAGVIATTKGARGISVLVRWPIEVVAPALAELLDDGCLQDSPAGYAIPRFMEAQECPMSNGQRKREERDRRRTEFTKRDGVVTKRDGDDSERDEVSRGSHTESHGVTPSLAVPSRAEPNLAEPEREAASPPPPQDSPALAELKAKVDAATGEVGKRRARSKEPSHPLPDGWKPTAEHFELGRERHMDIAHEARKFQAHAEANDRRAVRWNAAFTQWLLSNRNAPNGQQRLLSPTQVAMAELERLQREEAEAAS